MSTLPPDSQPSCTCVNYYFNAIRAVRADFKGCVCIVSCTEQIICLSYYCVSIMFVCMHRHCKLVSTNLYTDILKEVSVSVGTSVCISVLRICAYFWWDFTLDCTTVIRSSIPLHSHIYLNTHLRHIIAQTCPTPSVMWDIAPLWSIWKENVVFTPKTDVNESHLIRSRNTLWCLAISWALIS